MGLPTRSAAPCVRMFKRPDMMKLTRTAIGLLTAQYRSVLRKCMLINLGLFALGAAIVAAPSDVYATGSQHVVPSGTTVDKIDETFSGNTITNVRGGFTENSGTINYIDAVVSGNTINSSNSGLPVALIYNAGGATIKNIIGSYTMYEDTYTGQTWTN